MSLTQLG
jgi:hypothetical protein